MLRIRRISKEYYLRQVMACWLACYMLFGIPVQMAMGAIPVYTDDGGATITQGVNTNVLVNQTETIIKWSNFNTVDDELVAFEQGGLIDSAVLNRISGGQTQFNGDLTGAGMRIFMINPAGIVFGSTATVNVSQLVASSLDIDDADFINGMPYEFTGGLNAGDVINEGSITAERIALIAKNVINRGHILADECAIMAAGDTVLISENSPVAVEVTMPDGWVSGSGIHDVKNEDGDGIEVDGETAQVILAAGDVWSAALVKASAGGSEAVATIDIDAAGDVTVTDKVIAEAVGDREVHSAIATIAVNAGGDVDVTAIGLEGEEASIKAVALDGITNTAEVLICADGYVTVEAKAWKDLSDRWHGGIASIEAIAGFVDGYNQSNTADVQIGAGEGINVTASGRLNRASSEASIAAYASGGAENTAGVLACANDDVQVIAEVDSEAMIKSEAGAYTARALQAYPSSSSDAETTVISHTGDVVVDSSLGGNASIESVVYGGSTDTATTQVYATDVTVSEGAYIGAITQGDEKYVPGEAAPDPLSTDYCLTEDGEVAKINEDGSTLIIDSSDCPDCPPCPCEEEELLAPVAPLAQFEIPRVEGCPVLTQAAAMELGITGETLQVAIGNALALNPTIQPCEACATLVDAASILRDEDGSRMAAMVQAFNALAPADAPFTPETAASIAMAFEGAAEGTQYASVMEYIDTFVQYVAVLDIELGSPVGDSVAFVMDKYGADITGSDNSNIAAFVATRLEAISQ